MSSISINLKHSENERLKEYITMEQEKLAEAQRYLQEDKEKFDVLMTDTEQGSKSAQEEAKKMADEKKNILKKIDDYNLKILQKDVQMKKIQDDLIIYK